MACIDNGSGVIYCTASIIGWDYTEHTQQRRRQALIQNLRRDIKRMERKPKMKAKDLAKAKALLEQL